MTSPATKPRGRGAPKIPTPAPAPGGETVEPTIQPRRVWISYVFDDDEGFQRFARVSIDGLPDLRTLQQVLSTEQVIAEQKGVKNVQILNWHPLEG